MSDRKTRERSVSSSKLKGWLSGTVAVDPPSIAAASIGTVDVTIAGLTTAHRLILHVPADLEAGLGYAGHLIPAAGTLRIRLVNPTAAPIDGASRTWIYIGWIP